MADTAEQTRVALGVALPWQQGEARGTLNLPAGVDQGGGPQAVPQRERLRRGDV